MRFGRILVALVIIGAIAALGAYWIGPGVVPRAELRLLALDADSRFAVDARLPLPDSLGRGPSLQPLILAVSNTGARESGVLSIALSAPGWIRLHTEDGPIEPTSDMVDEPLVQYVFPLGGERIEPGALPLVPAGLGRMWVSVDLPAITCSLRWDGVPEFAPSPPWNAGAMATTTLYYSIGGERHRHTGVLNLELDPATFTRAPASLSADDPVIRRPGFAMPSTDSLTLHGERMLTCGAPGRRITLHAMVWRTGPGRLYVISHAGLDRRILFDANGDGLIEREAWDGDADGLFEASRTTSFAPPKYLLPADTATAMPLPAVPATAGEVRDTATVDTVGTGAATVGVRADSAVAAGRDTLSVDTVGPAAGRVR